jgi:hypothetical protein
MKVLKIVGFMVWRFIVLLIGIMIGQSPTSQREKTVVNSTVTQPIEPTQDNSKVEVKSETLKQDSGYAKIVGEVINNTQNPVEYVKVTATFYDKDKKVIGTSFTYTGDTSSTQLKPGDTTPFDISSYPDKFIPDSYKLDVSWR